MASAKFVAALVNYNLKWWQRPWQVRGQDGGTQIRAARLDTEERSRYISATTDRETGLEYHPQQRCRHGVCGRGTDRVFDAFILGAGTADPDRAGRHPSFLPIRLHRPLHERAAGRRRRSALSTAQRRQPVVAVPERGERHDAQTSAGRRSTQNADPIEGARSALFPDDAMRTRLLCFQSHCAFSESGHLSCKVNIDASFLFSFFDRTLPGRPKTAIGRPMIA